MSFGPDDTGPLPHWTAPPTGEIPSLGTPPTVPAGDDDSDDVDVDVWSTFTTESPVWRDDDPVTTVMDQVPREADPSSGADRSGGTTRADTSAGYDRSARAEDITGSGEYGFSSDYGRYATGYGSTTGDLAPTGARPGDLSGEVSTGAAASPGGSRLAPTRR